MLIGTFTYFLAFIRKTEQTLRRLPGKDDSNLLTDEDFKIKISTNSHWNVNIFEAPSMYDRKIYRNHPLSAQIKPADCGECFTI